MATMSVHIDDETKKSFNAFCEEAGISSSAAFVLFAKTVVREQCIPFLISTDPFFSVANTSHLIAAAKRDKAGLSQAHDLPENV